MSIQIEGEGNIKDMGFWLSGIGLCGMHNVSEFWDGCSRCNLRANPRIQWSIIAGALGHWSLGGRLIIDGSVFVRMDKVKHEMYIRNPETGWEGDRVAFAKYLLEYLNKLTSRWWALHLISYQGETFIGTMRV